MIVTRFAPSPTGYLHIGGARTALFSYLYARHHGGKFLLRVEDTDADRNNDDATTAILTSMQWLGLDWDDAPVYQSTRGERHREVAEMLLASGHAYRDFTSREEEERIRSEWAAANPKRPYLYRAKNIAGAATGDASVIRFKMPDDNVELTIDDAVQGRVKVQSRVIEDFVLLRSDGSPTFLLACTVDDHDMGVTDVIRGDDHLNNAFKQNLISQALGWTPPRYAHVPLIHNPEGRKFSKRDGAASVGDYETDYLPEAVFNYLLRLGWGHGNDEIISREQAIEWFDIKDVGRNPARIDPKKLLSVNSHYLQEMEPRALAYRSTALDLVRAACIMPEITKRAKTLSEVNAMVAFMETRPEVEVDPRAREIVTILHDTDWSPDALQSALRNYADAKGVKLGEVAGLVRFALTGMTQHIGVFDLLLTLGRHESIARLNR
jgi:glutamyl-tRNA synthetase